MKRGKTLKIAQNCKKTSKIAQKCKKLPNCQMQKIAIFLKIAKNRICNFPEGQHCTFYGAQDIQYFMAKPQNQSLLNISLVLMHITSTTHNGCAKLLLCQNSRLQEYTATLMKTKHIFLNQSSATYTYIEVLSLKNYSSLQVSKN